VVDREQLVIVGTSPWSLLDRNVEIEGKGMTVMTVIVNGHGERVDNQTTFAPVGRKLQFYSGFDVDLSQNVALRAIANRAKAQGTIDGTGTKEATRWDS
jgi:hypothetical protein